MNIIPIVTQLQTYATLFTNVYSAAEISDAVEAKLSFEPPFAYVVFIGDEAEKNTVRTGGVMQNVTSSFSVVVCVDASADIVGATGMTLEAACQKAINSAILGWNPDKTRSSHVIEYAGSGLEVYELPRVIWRFDYIWIYNLTSADCFQIPNNPFTTVGSSFNVNGASVEAQANLPQPPSQS